MNKERIAAFVTAATITLSGCSISEPAKANPTQETHPSTSVTDVATETTSTPKLEDIATLPSSREETPANQNTRETAELKNGKYILHDSDNNPVEVDLSQAIGFTPDKNLIVSDLQPKKLDAESASITRDFQKYLNTKVDFYDALAGFYPESTNDYNQYGNHKSGPQVPAYSWMIHTGLSVDMLGIGKVEGGPGRMASILIINRTDKVYRFPTESVTVIAGFQGEGRVWNCENFIYKKDKEGNLIKEPKDVIEETDRRLTNHFLTRFGEGVPEVGFIGQTDQGEKNADSATVITVERIQWGNNADGTPRYQFRLIRAETDPAIKK